ncbi:hypothetical protein BDEG_24375 [Batrachochytrium dendrobatidis JEL423]|uniref:D-aminoacyl-tRNA deacylase n=1 Tax=Batrachochytrium dendrobatidis (strain JEL423) TaxID=403673 RepID=A0A177WKN8_BATDL|nr:hypothetical protein BDEG_24375 [Batrachochytrium dendrobatidis JEL423]
MGLKVFQGTQSGKQWDANIKDINGDVLCVSQFTLYAKTSKGNKPDFHLDGVFGAMMKVDIVNEGPVTIILDTDNNRPIDPMHMHAVYKIQGTHDRTPKRSACVKLKSGSNSQRFENAASKKSNLVRITVPIYAILDKHRHDKCSNCCTNERDNKAMDRAIKQIPQTKSKECQSY